MKKRLLFIGDSLIEYFDWSARFSGYEVYNFGNAGETVEGLRDRLSSILSKVHDPDMVFIMSGINNMAIGDRGFIRSYRDTVKAVKESCPDSKIVIQSLLPVMFPFIDNNDIQAVNTELGKIAREENVMYLDIHSVFLGKDGQPKAVYLMDDGVHLSNKGYSVWSDEVEKLLL